MLLTVKQFLISFKKQSTKQVQLVDNKGHELRSKQKRNKQTRPTKQSRSTPNFSKIWIPLSRYLVLNILNNCFETRGEKKCPYI